MDRLQMSVVCLLLKMTFDPVDARCPTCTEGYFMTRNCSVERLRHVGIRCQLCTNCSAVGLQTLVNCSIFRDSVCGNHGNKSESVATTTAQAPVAAASPQLWIIIIIIAPATVLVLALLLLLSHILVLLNRRHHKTSRFKGLDPL